LAEWEAIKECQIKEEKEEDAADGEE